MGLTPSFLMRRPPSSAQQRGRWAEQRVAWYLRCRGWRLVARNWFGGGGELDLVLSRWTTLLVVEVRFRAQGDPLLSVDEAKLARTMRAARALVRGFHLERYTLRIDLAAVDGQGRIHLRSRVEQLL